MTKIDGRNYEPTAHHRFKVFFNDKYGQEFHRVVCTSPDRAVFCAMRADRAAGGEAEITFLRVELA